MEIKIIKIMILLSILFIVILLAVTSYKTARYTPRCEIEKTKIVEVKKECPVYENDCSLCEWTDRPAI